MTAIPRIIVVASAALALAIPASAGGPGDIKVDFTYNPAAPTADIYADFEESARRACVAQTHGMRGLVKLTIQKRCQADLMDRAVMKMNKPDLIALHEQETGRQMDAVNLARRNAEPLSSTY